jgi:superfamily II DNA or RNA helicase
MQHDIAQLIKHFPTTLYQRGEALAHKQAVFDLNSKNQGAIITARVRDEDSSGEAETHRVFIAVNPSLKTPFEGECSCEIEENCAHVIATLIAAVKPELLTQAENALSTAKNTNPPHSTSKSTSKSTKALPPHTDHKKPWLHKIRSKQYAGTHKPTLSIFYNLCLNTYFGHSQLLIEIFVGKRTIAKGSSISILSDTHTLTLNRQLLTHPPRYLTPSDHDILSALFNRFQQQELTNPLDMTHHVEAALIQQLDNTGRCQLSSTQQLNDISNTTAYTPLNKTRWTATKNTPSERRLIPISLSTTKQIQPIWQINQQGYQWLTLHRLKQGIAVFGKQAPFYLDMQHNTWGILETDLSKETLQQLANNLTLSPNDIHAFLTKTHESSDKHPLPPPLQFPTYRLTNIAPKPVLYLYSRRISKVVDRSYRRPAYIDGVAVFFDYSIEESPIEENSIKKGTAEKNATEKHRIRKNTIGKGTLRFHANASIQEKNLFYQGHLNTVVRDSAKEQALLTRLLTLAPGLIPLNQLHETDWTDAFTLQDSNPLDYSFINDIEWETFLLDAVETLKTSGWQLQVDTQFRYHYAHAQAWYGNVTSNNTKNHTKNNAKWFNLELGIIIDGERINLLPIIVEHIQRKDTVFSMAHLKQQPIDANIHISLPDGRIIPLPVSRIKRILSIFVELYETPKMDESGRFKLDAIQSLRLGELSDKDRDNDKQDSDFEWHGYTDLFNKAQKLRTFNAIEPVAVPQTVNATLRDYQQTGLNWLNFLRQFNLGGILADDMGLGKTLQVLALMAHEKQENRLKQPALVVAPTSVISNWYREAKKFTPNLNVIVFHGPNRHEHQPTLIKQDIVVTSYALIYRDLDYWKRLTLSFIILDEAHHIKNRRTKVASAIRQLEAQHRLCLTGTPMENHLGEMWSIFDFLMPKFLGTEKEFRENYKKPIEKDNNEDRATALSQRVAPFLLRRTKSQVASDLPPKTEIIKTIPFNEAQHDLYESIRLSMDDKVRALIQNEGIDKNQLIVLDALLKLRQICCDPRLLQREKTPTPIEATIQSAKLEFLMQMLPDLLEEGRRVLLFSQFASMLALIEKRLKQRKIPFVTLTGTTRHRDKVIDQFQSKQVPLFLISLKAGGTGLNLTAADTVIHYDPWWNPATENQATDRAYRIGQDKPVFVYKLLIENSIEEAIFQMQKEKLNLVESIYQNTTDINIPFKLSSEALVALLQGSH